MCVVEVGGAICSVRTLDAGPVYQVVGLWRCPGCNRVNTALIDVIEMR